MTIKFWDCTLWFRLVQVFFNKRFLSRHIYFMLPPMFIHTFVISLNFFPSSTSSHHYWMSKLTHCFLVKLSNVWFNQTPENLRLSLFSTQIAGGDEGESFGVKCKADDIFVACISFQKAAAMELCKRPTIPFLSNQPVNWFRSKIKKRELYLYLNKRVGLSKDLVVFHKF